jgi:predicted DNA-binding transcriptional regulator YafY
MYHTDTKRISRLTAILTQLQTKRLLTAFELADKFSVSTRTIYRDIRTLEQAGVPIVTKDGKGYSIMEHYRIPPVMFTESEANALITAEQVVQQNKDVSFIKAYSEAIAKIKAVLKPNMKDKANLLSERVQIIQNAGNERTSSNLSALQFALTNFHVIAITYTNEASKTTNRTVEPFAILNAKENWLLLALCRLSNKFRFFRLDRIKRLEVLPEKFKPHEMTLQEYFKRYY